MSDQRAVNLNSLNILKTELLATIQQATNELEQFISARERQDLQDACCEHLQQVLGAFRVAQLQGADLLATEMLESLTRVPVGADTTHDATLAAISSSAFVLTRYFEYVQQYERAMPVLLLPFVNELRETRQASAVAESHFLQMNPAGTAPPLAATPFSAESARRFRHMYQTGLLGVLQGNKADYSLGLMQRALERVRSLCASSALGTLLWVASASLAAVREKHLTLGNARKKLYAAVDRLLRQLVQGGTADNLSVDPVLLRELVYLVAVSGSDSELAKQVKHQFAVMPLGYSEADVEEELSNLRGPGLSTVQSIAEVIREELHASKHLLETTAQSDGDLVAGLPGMAASLGRVAETLAVVGLLSPAAVLKEQVAKVREWDNQKRAPEHAQLVELADTLLYIESTVSALQNINLSHARLAEANAMDKEQIIAKSQLAEAEKVVLDEAQAGIALVKRAMASYAESGFDPNHIANLGKSLNSVRGALILLNMPRAAKVCESCIQFVDGHLLRQTDAVGAIPQLMETFADAVMSLEYFLEAYIAVHKQDGSILDIAEESVKALGFPVH